MTGRGVVLLVVLALLAVVVTFVGLAHRSSAPTVAVVGDSITFFAGRDVTAALGTKYDADVHSGIGKRIDEMVPTLQAAIRKHPFAVVVNLGTNDARQAQTHPDWRSGFERMTALLTPARCALVTTISTVMDGPPGTQTIASEINQAITATVSAHHNLHVVDWNAAVTATNGANLLMPDRVHPSAAGQLTLASLVRTALYAACRQP
ncbi:MAG: SGNH/GDSL hydrolase family protein [Actinomycetota bacterium]|nr:SGNH/GDSL hydrolase family protein [Actinomycetota bacterium]